MSDEEDRCANCRFCMKRSFFSPGSKKAEVRLECRKNPPVPNGIATGHERGLAVWPVVQSTDWCDAFLWRKQRSVPVDPDLPF